MGRGLGKVQRAVLDALDAFEAESRRGKRYDASLVQLAGYVYHREEYFYEPDQRYYYLEDEPRPTISHAEHAAVSRAAHALHKAGLVTIRYSGEYTWTEYYQDYKGKWHHVKGEPRRYAYVSKC